MIDIKKVRESFDDTVAALERRGVDKAAVAKARDLDAKRRELVAETESLKAKRNAASKEIGKVAKEGGDIAAALEEVKLRSRQYAKRQLTWMRREEDVLWLDADMEAEELQQKALAYLEGMEVS